jgi:hypothetical protein
MVDLGRLAFNSALLEVLIIKSGTYILKCYMRYAVFLIFPLLAFSAIAAESATNPQVAELKKQAQQLKSDILSLSQDLAVLEEALLYPPDVKFGVFLSLTERTRFKLDSIELFVDDTLVSSHLYQPGDLQSLLNGGLQQLYMGSVAPGKHKLTASFNGQGRTGGYFKRKKALNFDKTNEARFIQLIVAESPTTGEPIFKVKQW